MGRTDADLTKFSAICIPVMRLPAANRGFFPINVLNNTGNSLMFLSYVLPRSVVRITGNDRTKHLHSFCTADIRAMQPGDIREAMVLDTKGKLKCLVHVLCREDSLELNTVPNQAKSLIAHLDKYVIREDVRFQDCTESLWHTFFFPGIEFAATDPLPLMDLAANRFVPTALPASEFTLCHGDFAGPGYLVQSADSGSGLPGEWIELAKAKPATEANLQFHRIGNRCPWFEVDCDGTNLPQELQRDAQSISFNKGCYLGQETVARIDALGHVHQLLVSIRSNHPASPPPIGTELKSAEQTVGKLTSVAADPATGHWIGLAIVKRKATTPGAIQDCHILPVN